MGTRRSRCRLWHAAVSPQVLADPNGLLGERNDVEEAKLKKVRRRRCMGSVLYVCRRLLVAITHADEGGNLRLEARVWLAAVLAES